MHMVIVRLFVGEGARIDEELAAVLVNGVSECLASATYIVEDGAKELVGRCAGDIARRQPLALAGGLVLPPCNGAADVGCWTFAMHE